MFLQRSEISARVYSHSRICDSEDTATCSASGDELSAGNQLPPANSLAITMRGGVWFLNANRGFSAERFELWIPRPHWQRVRFRHPPTKGARPRALALYPGSSARKSPGE